MKYIKTYESNNIRYTIDIRFLSKDEIIQVCKNLMKIFPDYSFNNRFIEIAKDNYNYTQWLSDYSHIELSHFNTYFEAGEYDPKYYFSHSGTLPIDGSIFLKNLTKEQLIREIEIYKTTKKYNL